MTTKPKEYTTRKFQKKKGVQVWKIRNFDRQLALIIFQVYS
jgi:hypothetical protein